MAHNGINDINGTAMYGEGNPSELSCVFMEGNDMGLKKGPWTAVEDRILMEYVSKHGEGNWNSVQWNSGLKRCGKSCRLRWANHLRPNLKKGAFTPEEERLILELHAKYGNKWARMASQLPGRTDNEIKNYWNTRVKKRRRKGLPLYPHDINPSKRVCQSHSHSQQNVMSIPTGVTQLSTTTVPQTDTSFSFQLQASSSQNKTQLLPLPSQNHPNSTLNHSLPLFDLTTSSCTTSVPSFTFHRPTPMLGTTLGYKRYQEITGFSPPISPTPQRNSSILRTSSMPDIASYQQFASGTSSMPDNTSFQFQPQTFNESLLPLPRTSTQFNFGDSLLSPISSVYSMNSEFPSSQVSHTPEPPSSQVSQTPQLPSSQASQEQSLSEITTTIDANINATPCSDGVLEELLQEAETFGRGSHPITKPTGLLDSFEKNHVLDGYGHSPASTSMDSSLLEMYPTQDHEHMNSIPKYLSKLFSFNLSMEPVSNSYNGESRKLPNSQSSGVAEASLEFGMQQHMDSMLPPVLASIDYDTVPNSWDNLPESSVEVS
ncbi:hypothetical protein ABKV19_004767 [Rosa sericea]